MADEKKILATLKALRADIANTQQQVQSQLDKVDAAIGEVEDLMKPGLRVGNSVRSSTAEDAFASAEIRDTAAYIVTSKDLDFTREDLVKHDDLLAGFADPDARRKNLRNIWDQNLRVLARAPGEAPGAIDHDIALAMTENRADNGLAMTTLDVAQDTDKGIEVVSVHILRNNALDKTVIVGGAAPGKLREAFRKANVIYVDRTASTAVEDAQKAVAEMLGPKPAPYIEDRLIDAFLYRNEFTATTDENYAQQNRKMHDLGIAKALVAPKVETLFPKYVVKKP